MANKREVEEGIQAQGKDEGVVWSMRVTPAPVAVLDVTVWDEGANTEVTATVMPEGTVSFAGNVITFPKLKNLSEGRTYRVEALYSDGVNELEPFFRVICER